VREEGEIVSVFRGGGKYKGRSKKKEKKSPVVQSILLAGRLVSCAWNPGG